MWIALGALVGCAEPPVCPAVQQPLPAANAGCLIVSDGRLVLVQELTGAISLPGGTREAGESSQCTAFRETWEETGLEVEVHERLAVLGQGFDLFRCSTNVAPGTDLQPSMRSEVPAALWLAPGQFGDYRWRFPDQRPLLEDLVEQVSEMESERTNLAPE